MESLLSSNTCDQGGEIPHATVSSAVAYALVTIVAAMMKLNAAAKVHLAFLPEEQRKTANDLLGGSQA